MKRNLLIVILLLAILSISVALTACSLLGGQSFIDFGVQSLTLIVGETHTLNVTAKQGTGRLLVGSSNPDVVKVEDNVVTAISKGETTIYAYVMDGQTMVAEAYLDVVVYQEYTVTFKSFGEVVSVQTFTSLDRNVTAPTVPEREGYTGAWESYVLGDANIVVNAIYTKNTGLFYALTEGGDGYLLQDVNGEIADVVVAENYNGKPVVGVAPYAADGNPHIQRVVLPNSICTIGEGAFKGCSNLVQISGGSVHTVGDKSFQACQSLTSFPFANAVQSIGDYAFENTALESFPTNCNPQAVGEGAFSNCKAITSLTIPTSLKVVAKDAFKGCENIKTLTILGDIDEFGDGAFADFLSLESINYYSNTYYNLSLTNGVFLNGGKNSQNGITITIGSNARIPEYLFYPAKNEYVRVKNIVIEQGATKIDYFNQDTNFSILSSVTLPSTISSPNDICIGFVDLWYDAYPNSKVDGITYINNWAMRIDNHVTQAHLKQGTTLARNGAFQNKYNLTSVSIPSSFEHINEKMFAYCGNVEALTIANGVQTIGANAFECCYKVTQIDIPQSVQTIGANVFVDCIALQQISLPFVGNSAQEPTSTHFGYLFGSENVYQNSAKVPQSLQKITVLGGILGEKVFYGCENIIEIVVGNDVTLAGKSAFENCNGLQKLSIPTISSTSSQAYLGYLFGASNYQGNATKVPQSLQQVNLTKATVVDGHAFEGCQHLEKVILPTNLQSIGANAFSGCTALAQVEIPQTVTSIGEKAFYDCQGLEQIVFTMGSQLKTIGANAFYNCGITSVNIPHGVTEIGNRAFYSCGDLQQVAIPTSVETLGEIIFYDCNSLANITVPFVGNKSTEPTQMHFGYLFGAPNYSSNVSYVPISLKNVTVAGGESIFANAFYGCASIQTVTLPDSVTTLGANAFDGCSGLLELTISQNVKSINAGLLNGCNSLQKLTIPFVGNGYTKTHFGFLFGASNYQYNGVNVPTTLKQVVVTNGSKIDDNAFYGCENIQSITLPSSVTTLGENVFYGCESLTELVLPSNVTSIGAGLLNGCVNLQKLTIPFVGEQLSDPACGYLGHLFGASNYQGNSSSVPQTLEEVTISNQSALLPAYAFYGCENIQTVAIPQVEQFQIGANAFYGCTKLANIQLANEASIGESAFENCKNLNADLSGAKTIGKNAFKGCVALTLSQTLTATTVGQGAFYGCTGLVNVTLDGTYTVESNAFYGCTGLTKLSLGNRLTEVGANAFYGCTSLESFTLPSGLLTIGANAFNFANTFSELRVSASVTEIGENAFGGWTSLTYLAIPFAGDKKFEPTQTNVGYAFGSNSALSGVKTVVLSNAPTVYAHTFSGCTALRNITISVNTSKIENLALVGCNNLETLAIPFIGQTADLSSGTGLNTIWHLWTQNAFVEPSSYSNWQSACFQIASVDTLTITGDIAVQDKAFAGFYHVKNINFTGKVSSIGQKAFLCCANLQSVTLPSSVQSIGAGSFNYAGANNDNIDANTGLGTIKHIYFGGSQEQWVSIGGTADGLLSDKTQVHFGA